MVGPARLDSVGGWVSGWVEENEAVGMSCCVCGLDGTEEEEEEEERPTRSKSSKASLLFPYAFTG